MSKSLIQFIIEEQRHIPNASGDFTGLLSDVISACKQIAHDVNKGALIGVLGSAGSENVQGETQKKLDIITNEVFIKANEWSGHLAAMASEEMDDIYPIPAKYPKGKYLITFDPLDGSSNIDVNISVGTIFSILRCPEGVTNPTAADFMQPGTKQVCAGYALYGPNTMMVITTGHGVNGFTLDRDVGDFFLTHPNMTIPGRYSRVRHQHVQPPLLGRAGATLCRRVHEGQGRRSREELQHALGRFDGRRSTSHPDTRRYLHVSVRHQGSGQGGQTASDVRSQSDVVHRRTGRWRMLDRT